MKKAVAMSLFIFWAIIAAILTAGLVFFQSSKAAGPSEKLNAQKNQSNSLLVLSSSEAAKHNAPSDCWLIIKGKVYDVSNFLNIHPGNSDTIIPFCGKDATIAFETKDKSPAKDHSQSAYALLADYYIGNLNQQIDQSKIQTVKQQTQNSSAKSKIPGAEDDNEFDD